MERKTLTGAAAGLILCLSAPAALAQLSAQAIADEWLELVEEGITVILDERVEGAGTVELRGVVLSEDTVRVTVPSILFVETGDGRVEVITHPEVVIEVETPGADFERVIGTIAFTGARTIVSGDDSQRIFAYEAESMVVSVDGFDGIDEEVPFDFVLDIGGMTGQTTVLGMSTERPTFSVSFEATTVTSMMELITPESDHIRASSVGSDLRFSGTVTVPPDGETDDMLRDGLRVGLQLEAGPGQSFFRLDSPFEAYESRSSSQGGRLAFSMSADGMSGEAISRGLDVFVDAGEMGMPPVALQVSEFAVGFVVPLLESATASPFGVGLRLVNLQPDAGLFAMFDPEGVIPRDPATLAFGVAGTGRWLVNIFDDAALMASDEPAEIEQLEVTELRIALGGAEINVMGRLSIDNTNRGFLGGFPTPMGTIEARATGVPELLGMLVETGLLPPQEVEMILGSMMMFAVPDDSGGFNATLEVTEGGEILLNGMPMPF